MARVTTALEKLPDEAKKELRESIKFIQESDYKGTAVKVELEAQLDRPEGRNSTCNHCDGDGYQGCSRCEGDGYTICESCDGEGCDHCDEEGEITCGSCDGDGRIECAFCAATGQGTNSRDFSCAGCKRFLLAHVPTEAKEALIYSKFYNDGSVDSEFTFTLPIDKADLVVYFIEAFAALGKEINPNRKLNVTGAGMHIAILNSSGGSYPGGNKLNSTKADSFRSAMTPLLPAMYFLASATHQSRGLRYRPPKVDAYDKYAAIGGANGSGVFEYRIFETCYERPLAFIDYMIVIANTLKFYKSAKTDTSMKLGPLGIRDGQGIDRFYYSMKHMEALERGLEVLRPRYKSVDELCRERSFKIGKEAMKAQEAKRIADWKNEYLEVTRRRHDERLRLKVIAERDAAASGFTAAATKEHVENFILRYLGTKETVTQYVKKKTDDHARGHNFGTINC